jgi:hypothetical protein
MLRAGAGDREIQGIRKISQEARNPGKNIKKIIK